MKLEHLSGSRIKTYKQCPLKYYAVYELEVPEEEPHHLTKMGSAVHLMLETAVNARKAGDLAAASCDPLATKTAAMKEFKVDRADGSLIDELVANAERWGYFRNIARTAGCEVEFNLMLPDGTKVKGFMDRLDLLPPCADIIDIKTQKAMFTDEELRSNWQARIYNWATRVLYPEVTGKASVSFWVLRHMVQKVWLTSHDAEVVVADLMDVAREIRACDKPEPRPSGLCRYCEYRKECPAARTGDEPRSKSWARIKARR